MALIVEDGTGKSDAESYDSVANVDAYHLAHGDPSEWSSSNTADKEEALRLATQAQDLEYGSRWKGRRTSATQALDWPRVGANYDDGHPIASNDIVKELTQGNAILALKVRQGKTLIPDIEDPGTKSREKIVVGPIETDDEFIGGKPPDEVTEYPMVDLLMSRLTTGLRLVRT